MSAKRAPGHVASCPWQAVLVDQVEHVGKFLVVLLSGEEVDRYFTRVKQCQMQLRRISEMYYDAHNYYTMYLVQLQ